MATATQPGTSTKSPQSALAALRSPAQRIGAVAVVLGLLVLMAALVTGNQAQQRIWDGLPTCEGAATADCVQVREGRFVVRTQNEKDVVYFHADDESGREKVSIDARHLRGGAKATASALYLGDDVIGIQERDGERHYRTGALDIPGWYLLGYAGALVLVVGGITALARPGGKR